MDPLIDWSDPLSLESSDLPVILARFVAANKAQPWIQRTAEGATFAQAQFKYTLFEGRFEVGALYLKWAPSRLIMFSIRGDEIAAADEQWLYDKLDERLKVRRSGQDGFYQWNQGSYQVKTNKDNQGNLVLSFRSGSQPPGTTPVVAAAAKDLAANLDALLAFATFWQWTPEEMEKSYTVKTSENEKQQKPPQFEWLSASKDRARFSRHMFSDGETKLTMFGGSINVEEAVIEFVNGKAARATMSFYNRGDSGDIKMADFDRIFKTVGQNLGQVTKVAPKRQLLSSNAALPVTGWMWSAPTAVALLEYNDYTKGGRPEFLRLKLAAPSQADWSMGKLATGIQRMELLKRVTKKPDGDVFISGVPMVDQGQKGYCVAASCQRLFEYMRIPCDQHEMAKLVSVDSENGADVRVMQKSLARIDGAFNVTFRPLINPEIYYAANGKRRVSEKEFLSLVKEYTEKGVPLLWGLSLGEKPEDPPLPNGGQMNGGHMRLIIGYNAAKHQLLFTDSWGSGHELKRMTMLDAYDVTMGVYSMAPRGL